MTADGKIATANRQVSSFSSRRDQALLMELRSEADAVMAGARTVDLNRITLGPGSAKYRRRRLRRGLAEHSVRVVVSGAGTLDPRAAIFRAKGSPLIILAGGRASRRRLERLRRLADQVKVFGARELDFVAALRWLRRTWGVKRLLCEGGGTLNDALFRAGVVDELHLTVCPKVFGGKDAPTISDGLGMGGLDQAVRLRLKSARRSGAELFLVYRVVGSALRARSQSKSDNRLR
jgi:riboflavin-specific deaminase-like protein